MTRSRSLPRCAYCNAPGLGDPPLCHMHFIEVRAADPADQEAFAAFATLYQQVADHPRVRALFDDLAATVTQRVREAFIDAAGARRAPNSGGAFEAECPPRPRARQPPPSDGAPRANRPPPRRPPDPQQAALDARVILGFPPTETLTIAKVKQRHRALTAIYHPDVGGSDESMKRLNVAVGILLRQLGAR